MDAEDAETNPKYEVRNPKQIRMTKIEKFKTGELATEGTVLGTPYGEGAEGNGEIPNTKLYPPTSRLRRTRILHRTPYGANKFE